MVGLVAILAIGPKELPTVVRQVARFIRQMKAMAGQFRQQFDLMDESGDLHALRKELREEIRLIQNEKGEVFESYDISDLIEDMPRQLSEKPKND